jgi:hypothetical protein
LCRYALVHKIGDWQKRVSGSDKAEAICVCHSDPSDMLAGERRGLTIAHLYIVLYKPRLSCFNLLPPLKKPR